MHVARNASVAFGVAAAAIGIAGGLLVAANSLQGGADPSPAMAGSVGSVSQQAVVVHVDRAVVNLAEAVATAPQPNEYMLDALPRSYGSAVHAYYAEYMLDGTTQWSRSALYDC
jgi:hypothetical protein